MYCGNRRRLYTKVLNKIIYWCVCNNAVTVPYVVHTVSNNGLSYDRLRQATSIIDDNTPPGWQRNHSSGDLEDYSIQNRQ